MSLLPLLALWSVLAFVGALGLVLFSDLPRQVPAHLAFAVGALPLVLAAMGHFVPVLTRSGAPSPLVRWGPLAALLGGVGVVSAFLSPALWLDGPGWAALPALSAVLGMWVWIQHRASTCLGAPHPGLYWYTLACFCAALALAAVPVMVVWPAQRAALRLFHLHLNTLGLIGLTALGTVQVLLPTALARMDPGVAARLRRFRHPCLAGVLLIALGTAWGEGSGRAMAWAGLALWLWALVSLLRDWWRLYRRQIFSRHGAGASLAAALAGLTVLSLVHGLTGRGGIPAIGSFFLAFLLPLVSGALSQLLPIWLCPGRQSSWHEQARQRLGRYAGLRALSFLVAGLGLLGGMSWLLMPVPLALGQFVHACAKVVATRKEGTSAV